LRDKYEDLRREHERVVNMAKESGNPALQGLQVQKNDILSRPTIMKRQETKMNHGLLNNLQLFAEESLKSDEKDEVDDSLLVCWLDEAAIDKKIVEHSRERSAMDSNLLTLHLKGGEKLDELDEDEEEEAEPEPEQKQKQKQKPAPSTKKEIKNEKVQPQPKAPAKDEIVPATGNRFAAAFHAEPQHKDVDIGSIKSSVEIHSTIAPNNNQETMQFVGTSLEFKHVETSNMSREDLIDYCDSLESQMIEDKSLRGALEQSQKVIIDHLMETNEGLLKWFQMKKIL